MQSQDNKFFGRDMFPDATPIDTFMQSAFGDFSKDVDEYVRKNPLPQGTELKYSYSIVEKKEPLEKRRSARLASKNK